jgi:hypothetical protein
MGLKGYRLWVMGQLDSTCSAPPRAEEVAFCEQLIGGGRGGVVAAHHAQRAVLDVALQVVYLKGKL